MNLVGAVPAFGFPGVFRGEGQGTMNHFIPP